MIELLHQRGGELVEGIRQDHHLVVGAQPGEKIVRAVERTHAANDGLDVGELQPVLLEDRDAVAHQLVVVGLVARGDAQRLDAGRLRDVDPDLRHEHAFEVQARNHAGVATGSIRPCKSRHGRCPATLTARAPSVARAAELARGAKPCAQRVRTATVTGATQVNGARTTSIVGVTATTSAGMRSIKTQLPRSGRQVLALAIACTQAADAVDGVESAAVDAHQFARRPRTTARSP